MQTPKHTENKQMQQKKAAITENTQKPKQMQTKKLCCKYQKQLEVKKMLQTRTTKLKHTKSLGGLPSHMGPDIL